MSQNNDLTNPPDTSSQTRQWDAPWPGSKQMPRWTTGELAPAPIFTWKHLPMMLGPGLVMGAAAVGGGEWLLGPLVTARYGGALLWLATISILCQVIYNIEISRYTLYTGEPIFTGKFRLIPGPIFWLFLYLLLDMGSFLPYLCSNAAIPLSALFLGELPNPKENAVLLKAVGSGILLLTFIPLIFGGKVYRSLKIIMTFKLVVVVGFLSILAIGYSTADTWTEIFSGFVKFGTFPVVTENPTGPPVMENVFVSLFSGSGFPTIDFTMIGMITAMAAIAGNGGLTNTPISGFTRDQGWGMGKEVGAIPSIIGGRSITLSHVGKVFRVTPESLKRWFGWVNHVQREQFLVWMPACFLGMALPSMLSVQFLPRGEILKDQWLAAGMTADGVANAVGGSLGPIFWGLTLFCGFLVLSTSALTNIDGALRRWVDLAWTASPILRKLDTHWIGKIYFGALMCAGVLGLTLLWLVEGSMLVKVTTMIYNYALGFSSLHVLCVNRLLLPKELQPSLFRCGALFFSFLFFTMIAILANINLIKELMG